MLKKKKTFEILDRFTFVCEKPLESVLFPGQGKLGKFVISRAT